MAALPGSEKSPESDSEIPMVRGFPAFGAVLVLELLLPQAARMALSRTSAPTEMRTPNRLTVVPPSARAAGVLFPGRRHTPVQCYASANVCTPNYGRSAVSRRKPLHKRELRF